MEEEDEKNLVRLAKKLGEKGQILYINGGVEEHVESVRRAGGEAREIRAPADIEGLDGIILPGGESTAMAIVGEGLGLFPKIKEWVQHKKPIWGTCAGMILLSDHALRQAQGGQALIGGLDVHVCRNFFGSQVNSCKLDMDIATSHLNSFDKVSATGSFPAVFIRAPAILKVGENVDILATVRATPHPWALQEVESVFLGSEGVPLPAASTTLLPPPPTMQSSSASSVSSSEYPASAALALSVHSNADVPGAGVPKKFRVAVAVRQDNILATAFHPELTDDIRWHRYFIDMVAKVK